MRYSGRCPHVVGVSISVAKLSLAASESEAATRKKMLTMKEANRSYGSWAVRRCDVYVVSFAPNLIERRLDVVKDLWKAGIKADLVRFLPRLISRSQLMASAQMYDDDLLTLTPEHLVSACRREGILWLVMVKPGADRAMSGHEPEKTLKVKSVLRGVEDEGALASWPHSILASDETRSQCLARSSPRSSPRRCATRSASTTATRPPSAPSSSCRPTRRPR